MSVQQLRRGLPRVSGGSAWPPGEGAVSEPGPLQPGVMVGELATTPTQRDNRAPVVVSAPDQSVQQTPTVSSAGAARQMRRGLPRIGGGQPWPSELVLSSGSAPKSAEIVESTTIAHSQGAPAVSNTASTVSPEPASAIASAVTTASSEYVSTNGGLRRGLPRTKGGVPWPLPGERPRAAPVNELVVAPEDAVVHDVANAPVAAAVTQASAPAQADASTDTGKPRISIKDRISSLPLLSKVLLGSAVFLVMAALVVISARLLVATPAVHSFLSTYPGETELPEGAPVGFPLWLGWQHFFNVFLMVLIIRSGLTVRREQRPGSYWAPRKNPTRKVSLMVWFHQTLDVLWLVNGVAFVALLFITGQWMRIVPTSWEVIPNAISAALQYASFDWPTESGWVNYNSLQVLAYFTTVFVAAPLAAITGFRMSTMWPQNAKKLSAAYPMEWARVIHFPVMLYFCGFIAVHVFLVFATGALRNLNHMYGNSDAVDWTGFAIFVASLVVIAVAWVLARPIIIAPLASKFGSVTSR